MALHFEWDAGKAATNVRKHGVSFGEAATTFGDLASIGIDGPVHSEAEDRFVIVGTSARRRLLITAFTERDDRIRIISSRTATSNERAQYEHRLQEDG
jgi:uncharacterized DUF497 family protein